MLGHGVNDVPALKAARLAIAQGSGTEMARSVSDLLLVSGELGEVPPMVGEGRQILRDIQRVARLFVSKAIFTAFLVLVIAIPSGVFPMPPRQFTLTPTFMIGIRRSSLHWRRRAGRGGRRVSAGDRAASRFLPGWRLGSHLRQLPACPA